MNLDKFLLEIGTEYTIKNIDDHPTCIISKIENFDGDDVVHISINNVLLDNNQLNEYIDIDHMPFSLNAFINSIDQMVSRGNVINMDFFDAYETWVEMKGGVWDIEISEAVKITVESIR